jgi:hypothetical protein
MKRSTFYKALAIGGIFLGSAAMIGFGGLVGTILGPILIILSIGYITYDANHNGSGYMRVAMD